MRTLFALLLLTIYYTGLSAQKQIFQPAELRKTSLKHKATLPGKKRLQSTSGETGLQSPCAGVPAMTYFEIDDVFHISGRGIVASGVLHEGMIMTIEDAVPLYAVKEWKLRYILKTYADPVDRALKLTELQHSPDAYLVSVQGIERFRKPFNVLVANPDEYGLFLTGVTRRELTKDHVLVDFETYVDRFGRCNEIIDLRPVRIPQD